MSLKEQVESDMKALLSDQLTCRYGCDVMCDMRVKETKFVVKLTRRHSLRCLCRHSVRLALKRAAHLPHGIDELCIPTKFKLFLGLKLE